MNQDFSNQDKLVLSYLKSRGFKQAENTLKQEAKIKDAPQEPISNFVFFHNDKESSDLFAYEKSYSSLRKWTLDSIDFYKSELEPVLYPIFIHSYLDMVVKGLKENARSFMDMFKSDHMDMHSQDITRLSGVLDPAHVSENPLSQSYRLNRYGIIMSRYPFELLLGYLQDQGFMLLLRIVNQYLNIQVTNDKPSDRQSAKEKSSGLIGKTESISSLVAEYPVSLGKLPQDVVFVKEVEKSIMQMQNSQSIWPEFQKWAVADPDAPDPALAIPVPPKKLIDVAAEIESISELSERVTLGPGALPSICAYTFHNTRDGLNCLDISENGNFIAGGFSDSYMKIWNLSKGSNIPPRNTRNDVEHPMPDSSIRLIGHSGPVYASSFSNDNKFLVSCSEDKTARLWSMDTFKNVVVYKGHNYPIWDVDVGPLGFYFATASHDRTARLWSPDHIYSLRIFVGHLSDVDVVRFHPNSNYIVTGSSDKTCRMWDIQRGSTVRMFTGHMGPVSSLAISPDGKSMVSATSSGLILWDLASGKKIKSLNMNNQTQVHSLEFSRDNKIIAAGCGDEAVRVWDAQSSMESSDELGIFYTKKTPVYKVHFSKRNLLYALGNFIP